MYFEREGLLIGAKVILKLYCQRILEVTTPDLGKKVNTMLKLERGKTEVNLMNEVSVV